MHLCWWPKLKRVITFIGYLLFRFLVGKTLATPACGISLIENVSGRNTDTFSRFGSDNFPRNIFNSHCNGDHQSGDLTGCRDLRTALNRSLLNAYHFIWFYILFYIVSVFESNLYFSGSRCTDFSILIASFNCRLLILDDYFEQFGPFRRKQYSASRNTCILISNWHTVVVSSVIYWPHFNLNTVDPMILDIVECV